MTAVARTSGKKVVLSESGHLWVGGDCYLPMFEPEGVFPVRPLRRKNPGDVLNAAEINNRYGYATNAEVAAAGDACARWESAQELRRYSRK